MLDLGLSLIAMRLLAYGFAKHAHEEAAFAKARYDAAKEDAKKQYPKTAHELGELALVRAASASWVLDRLAAAAEARGLRDRHQPAKILGGKSLEHAVRRIHDAHRFRVRMDFSTRSPLSDVIGIAIMTRRIDRLGLIPIPALHYPLEKLLADTPFGGVVADLAIELHIYTVGDLLGDALMIWSIKRTIDMFTSVGRYYEMAARYNAEAAQLERFTAQLVEMEHSARQLRIDHPVFCADVVRWLIISEEAERLSTAMSLSDARWIASELARAAKAYVQHLEAPVAGASDGVAPPEQALGAIRLGLRDFAPATIVANVKKAIEVIREGRRHQKAGDLLKIHTAEIPHFEPALRQEVAHILAQRTIKSWAA